MAGEGPPLLLHLLKLTGKELHHSPMIVEPCNRTLISKWIVLRQALWPSAEQQHIDEAEAILNNAQRAAAFIGRSDDGQPVGFVEVCLRSDYVNGCDASPVAFIEGIFVAPGWRNQGIARILNATVEQWALAAGCEELGSDTAIENVASQRMHQALGFVETERVVFFKKRLSKLDARPS